MSESMAQADPRLISGAIHSLADGLALLDADACIMLWNLRAEGLTHLSATEMLGKRADELLDHLSALSAAPDATRARLQAAFDGETTDRAVEMEILPTGETTASDLRARVITVLFFAVHDVSGDALGTGILLRDVTQERSADAMKSQLLSTVSHELRTPLASIKGFATTLLRQDVKWDEATQRDFLKIIEEESDRLTEIIDNLLDMSQIEAGALRINKESVQLRQLIREVVDEMRMRTESHYFVVDLPAELPRVMIDPRRIRQVLQNLIGNAIKYSARGQITITCEVEDRRVVVSVSDQGGGIPSQYLDRIFDRFFQVDSASSRRVGGSGLGLAISRGIIEAHDGRIWAESVQGQGSTFRFSIPIVENEVPE